MIQQEGTGATEGVSASHRLEVPVSGLSCSGDAAPLARRLEVLPGVHEAVINPITEQGVIRFDPLVGNVAEILDILEALGAGARGRMIRWHGPAPGCLCGGCREPLEARLESLPGIEAVILNRDENSVTVECVPARTNLDLLLDALTTPDQAACRSAG